MPFDDAFLRARLDGAASALASLRDQAPAVLNVCRAVHDALARGGTVFTCGNGGSAAEALHLSEELVGKYRSPRPARRAMCLAADPTALTCIANDFGFEAVFSRQVEALARKGDVLVGLTTSGASPNVRRAFETARRQGVTTVGLLGRDGGACRGLCDHAVIVPGPDTGHIQEAHLVVIHLILEAVEA